MVVFRHYNFNRLCQNANTKSGGCTVSDFGACDVKRMKAVRGGCQRIHVDVLEQKHECSVHQPEYKIEAGIQKRKKAKSIRRALGALRKPGLREKS